MRNVWRGDFMGYWGVVMQDPACELPRIPIPRTSVNKDEKKGRGQLTMALQILPVRVGVRFLRLAYAGVSRTKRVVGGTLYAAHASEGYTHISTELISLRAVNTAAR